MSRTYRVRRKGVWLALFLILGGAAISGAALAAATGTGQEQLAAMVQVALSSRTYAQAAVGAAAVHGLATDYSMAKIASGDTLLARSQADLTAGTNATDGIASASEAMGDYTSASQAATAGLRSAGFATSVDVDALSQSVSLANSTLSALSGYSAATCTAIQSGSNNQSLIEACASIRSGLASARGNITLAESAVANLGSSPAAASIASAAYDVAQARAGLQAASSSLAVAASYAYPQKAMAFYVQVILPLSAKVNSTISFQRSALTLVSGAKATIDAFAVSQGHISSNFTALDDSLLAVDYSSVSSAGAQSVTAASNVNGAMSSFLTLLGSLGLPGTSNLTSSITVCSDAATSYKSQVNTSTSVGLAFPSTVVSGLASYSTELQASAGSASLSGSSLDASFAKVQTSLSSLVSTLGALAPPSLISEESTLASLKSGLDASIQGYNSALQAESGAVSVASTAESSTSAALAASSNLLAGVSISPHGIFLSLARNESSYLSPTVVGRFNATVADLDTLSTSASAFASNVQGALSGTVSALESSSQSVQSSASTAASAAAGVQSDIVYCSSQLAADIQTRSTLSAAAQGEIQRALADFNSLDIALGASLFDEAMLALSEAA